MIFVPVYNSDHDHDTSFTITPTGHEGTGDTDFSRGVFWITWTTPGDDFPPSYSGNTWIINEEKPVDWKAIKSLRREATLINAFDIRREHQNQLFQSRIPVNQKFKWRGSRI